MSHQNFSSKCLIKTAHQTVKSILKWLKTFENKWKKTKNDSKWSKTFETVETVEYSWTRSYTVKNIWMWSKTVLNGWKLLKTVENGWKLLKRLTTVTNSWKQLKKVEMWGKTIFCLSFIQYNTQECPVTSICLSANSGLYPPRLLNAVKRIILSSQEESYIRHEDFRPSSSN